MDQKLLTGIGVAVALLVFVGLMFALCEYKQEQDLSHGVKGRWEHIDRTQVLTVDTNTWRIDRWDNVTQGWHDINHGTWSVRDTGTFIFESELNNAAIPARLEGDTLWFDEQQFKRLK